MDQKLKIALAALLPAGPLALSMALAPPAAAAIQPPSTQHEVGDVAQRLANIQTLVNDLDRSESATADPLAQVAAWLNAPGVGWRNGGAAWRNGGAAWRNGGGGAAWRNGGGGAAWRNGGGWRNY